MPKWAHRLREIAARNPGALPQWMRRTVTDKVWYSSAWQTDAGVSPENAARPVLTILAWLNQRKQLTPHGAAVLKAAQLGNIESLALTVSMVQPKAAAFLESHWDKWFELHGINLTLGSESATTASAEIDDWWNSFEHHHST